MFIALHIYHGDGEFFYFVTVITVFVFCYIMDHVVSLGNVCAPVFYN